MSIKNNLTKLGPILVLFILSPIIAELLFGSTPASRATQLILESIFYGSGALLVREFARRNKLGWISIIILGIAFGVIEECVSLQSAFNPKFLGLDLSFGRFWGVNWVWAEIIIGYHAVWSITIPILISELLFPQRKTQPWLNRSGIAIFGILFALSTFAFHSFFYKMSGYSASGIQYLVAVLLVVGLIILSTRIPFKPLVNYSIKTPSVFIVGLSAFVGSALWFVLLSLIFRQGSGLPAWSVQLSGVIIIACILFLTLGWIKNDWNDHHRFALTSGGLLASMILGLVVLVNSKNQIDIISQIILIIVTTILLFILWKKKLNSVI
jgi:hypothetical protein